MGIVETAEVQAKLEAEAEPAAAGTGGTGAADELVVEPVDRAGLGSLQLAITPEPIREAGIPSFGGAEFDFKTAPCIREALAGYAEGGYYGFTLSDDEYLGRIEWWMANARGWEVDGSWVVPALGTIFSVATCLRMLVGPDDAMIVQPPVYYRYEQAATRLGLRCVHNPLIYEDGRYTMDFDGLERLMADPRNTLLVICNPANPVGRVWTAAELGRVAELSARYGTVVVSDEIFAEVALGGHRTTPYASIPAGRGRAIALTSIGKAFGCTGFNFANAIIPDDDLRERFEAQRTRDHFGSIDPFGRQALVAAYTPEGLAWQRSTLPHFEANRKIVADAVEGAGLGRVAPTEGTFVAWVEWTGLSLEGEELNGFLETEALLEVEPGLEYGGDCGRFSRINLAGTHEATSAAMERLVDACRSIRR